MSIEQKEPFTVRVSVEGCYPKAWIVWEHFSSDALSVVLEGLDLAQSRLWIRSAPSTPDECIENPVFGPDNSNLMPIPRVGGAFIKSKEFAAPPAAPADDHATPSGGQEAGPQEDRIEAAYWRFDARHKGYSQWKAAPMSERDAFKAEMRNALESEKVRAEMRLVARGWRRPDAPAAPAPAAPVPLTDSELAKIAVEDEFLLYCDQDSFNEIARAIEQAHGITGGGNG